MRYTVTTGRSRTAATFKVKIFQIINNGWKPLTIITKSSTLDVAAVLDPPLVTSWYGSSKFRLHSIVTLQYNPLVFKLLYNIISKIKIEEYIELCSNF